MPVEWALKIDKPFQALGINSIYGQSLQKLVAFLKDIGGRRVERENRVPFKNGPTPGLFLFIFALLNNFTEIL